MKLLLDTCTFLWLSEDSPKLSDKARSLFRDPDNEAYLSTASVWELAVKSSVGRLALKTPVERFVPFCRRAHGIDLLPVSEDAALHVAKLPEIHKDPFDRMLVAQAIVEGLIILTPDPAITRYPARVMW